MEGLSGALGNYSFQVHDAPIRDLGAASLDSDLVGDIAAPGEVHRYAFDALEGQRVFLDVVSVPNSFSLYWRLIDPAGREIRPGSYFAERGAFTLHAGTYTLEVGGYGNNTSPYTIRIADVVDQTLPTSPGSSLTGLLSNASSLDTHTFTAAGGELVYLDVVSAPSPAAASLRLVDPSGNTVASAPTLADLGPIDLIAGDWRVEVEASGPSLVPDYQIDLIAVVDSSAPASFGVPVAATVSEPGGTTSYEFVATAGQRVYFHPVDGVTPWIDWSLTRSSGEAIQPQTATLAWQGPYVLDADTYTLTIDPQGDRTGTWNVQLIEPADVSGASSIGSTVNGGISEPGAARELEYDPYGRPTMRREGAHVEERTYDGMYVDTIHVYGTDTIGHADATWDVSYDAAGRIVDLVGPAVGADPGLSVVHGYDWRGRLWQIDEVGLGTYEYGYDSANRVATLTRPGGLVTTTVYNGAGQTTGITTLDGVGSVVHEILTTYDARGLPDTQTDHEGLHDYEHDVAGRLIGVDHPTGAAFGDEAYSYDEADRRTSSHRDPLTEVVYDDGDRLLQDAEYTYGYDAEGRRTSRTHRVTSDVTTYSYNALDQMTELVEGGVTWTFVYDARDLRVLVMNDAGYGETFVYDDNGLVRATYDLGGVRTASYLTGFGFGEVLSRVDGAGVVDQAMRDRLGTAVGWVDPGVMFSAVERDSYGLAFQPPAGVMPFGFTGHTSDPTSLAWGRARCIAPTTGGWTSEDPVGAEPRYVYVGGRVASHVDPSGRSLEYGLKAAIGCGIIGGIVGFVADAELTGAGMAAACGATGNPLVPIFALLASHTAVGLIEGEPLPYGSPPPDDDQDTGY